MQSSGANSTAPNHKSSSDNKDNGAVITAIAATYWTLHVVSEPQQELLRLGKLKQPTLDSAAVEPQKLIQELYQAVLVNDPLFHFFYEPELIIRISSSDVLQALSAYLTKRGIKHAVYSYPTPAPVSDKAACERELAEVKRLGVGFGDPQVRQRYGEEPGGIVIRNLGLFLPVFHTHAVAALTLSSRDHHQYLERCIHTAFNMAHVSRTDEGQQLAKMAAYKLGAAGVVDYTEKAGMALYEDIQ